MAVAGQHEVVQARKLAAATVELERVATTRGAMTPLYAAAEAETVTVLEGTLTFFVGDDVVRARAGAVVVVPPAVARTVRVESERARWLLATRVRSVARFDDFARALARPAGPGIWACPEDEATLRALGAANGISVLGPPGRLPTDR